MAPEKTVYLGPDQWGARRIADRYNRLEQEAQATRSKDPLVPSLEHGEPVHYVPEPIPKDDPEASEFKWRVVVLTDRELLDRAHRGQAA